MCYVSTKQIMTDSFTKALSVINYEHFVAMIGIEDKKELLASIKRDDDLRDAFNNVKLILANRLGLKSLRPDI